MPNGSHLKSEECSECGSVILVMCFKRTGVCCEKCRKKRDGDEQTYRALTDAPIGGEK